MTYRYLAIPGLPALDASDDLWNMAEVYREPYVHTKYTIAARLQPRRICEIGVYSGIAAMCFLAACPDAQYVGIDNLSAERLRGIMVVTPAIGRLRDLKYDVVLHIADSQSHTALPDPPYDLVHVDADHSRTGAWHDVTLAWEALRLGGHLLVDNGHDRNVAAGTFDALAGLTTHLLDWEYLSEGVGSILVRKT